MQLNQHYNCFPEWRPRRRYNMKLPEGYEQYSKDGSLLYCLLMKVLYGLKQGERQWYLKLSKVMKEIGFRKVQSEPCVYVWEDSTGEEVVYQPMWMTVTSLQEPGRAFSTLEQSCKSASNYVTWDPPAGSLVLIFSATAPHARLPCPNVSTLLTCSRTLVWRVVNLQRHPWSLVCTWRDLLPHLALRRLSS